MYHFWWVSNLQNYETQKGFHGHERFKIIISVGQPKQLMLCDYSLSQTQRKQHHHYACETLPNPYDLEDLSRCATFRLTIFTTTLLMLQQIDICHCLGWRDTSRFPHLVLVCLSSYIRAPGKTTCTEPSSLGQLLSLWCWQNGATKRKKSVQIYDGLEKNEQFWESLTWVKVWKREMVPTYQNSRPK